VIAALSSAGVDLVKTTIGSPFLSSLGAGADAGEVFFFTGVSASTGIAINSSKNPARRVMARLYHAGKNRGNEIRAALTPIRHARTIQRT
jgi:hypothetical protein